MINISALLPVTLLSFTANPAEKSVLLSWQTATEENTEKYTLERSVDGGRTFLNIGSVAARNSSSGAEYEYLDETAARHQGTLYYRLIALDFDGATEVFGPVSVALDNDGTGELTIIPNPLSANSTVRIQGAAAGAKARLSAMDGRLLATLSPDGEGVYRIPDLPAGVYLVRSTDERSLPRSAKMIIR